MCFPCSPDGADWLASDFAALAPAAAPATTPRSVRGHCQRRQDFGGRGKNIAGREGLQFGVSSRQRLAVAGGGAAESKTGANLKGLKTAFAHVPLGHHAIE